MLSNTVIFLKTLLSTILILIHLLTALIVCFALVCLLVCLFCVEASLEWDTFEQYCVWQMLTAEGPDPLSATPLLNHISATGVWTCDMSQE